MNEHKPTDVNLNWWFHSTSELQLLIWILCLIVFFATTIVICVNYSLFKSVCSNHLYRSKFVLTIEGVDSDNKDKVGVADSDVTPISKSLDDIDVGGLWSIEHKRTKIGVCFKGRCSCSSCDFEHSKLLGKESSWECGFSCWCRWIWWIHTKRAKTGSVWRSKLRSEVFCKIFNYQ